MKELIASLLVFTAGCTVHVHEHAHVHEQVRVRHVYRTHYVEHRPAVVRYNYTPQCINLNPHVCARRGY